MSLRGKRVVVTGAASGIGLATTQVLRQRGAEVIGVDLAPSPAADESRRADLSDPVEIDALVKSLPDGISGLCNVAGVPPSAPPETVLAVNAKGLARLTTGLAPRMVEGGAIVNVASSAGMHWADSAELLRVFVDTPFEAAALRAFAAAHDLAAGGRSYGFSKEFVVAWTMRHRWAWRDRGIRVNAVSPGPVDTPILPDFVETLSRAKRVMDLMDRPGRPEEIAPVIAFLLSDDAGWIRGANIPVDGGLTALLWLERHGLLDRHEP